MRALYPVLASVLLLNGCSSDNDAPATPQGPQKTPVSKLGLKSFSADCNDFLAYAADALTEQYLTRFSCFGPNGICPVLAGAPPEAVASPSPSPTPAPATDSAGGTPGRVSETNTQEAGVDEADIVKAGQDGRLYIMSGRKLHILPAFPPAGLASRPLATVDIAGADESFYGEDFFLDETNDRVVVLGNQYDQAPASVNVVVDISNPEAPAVIARTQLSGFGLDARRIGNRVHRVSRFDVPPPDWFHASSGSLVDLRDDYFNALSRGNETQANAIKATVRTQIGALVAADGAEPLLPRLTAADGSESALACNAIAFPEVTTGMGLALVDSFNTDGSSRAASGVINNAYVVYASSQNLYLAQPSAGWFFGPSQAEETAIYKLALSGTGAASYQGVGTVAGSILGSYAMSEFNNDLRVASTESNFTGNTVQTQNQVSVLRANGAGVLNQVGIVSNLAPGERIQGVRYVGDKGYVVTFRQVDPLFALDLSNPAQPRVTDELKIPGFSSYLLPLGNTHLLTIGRAGDDTQLNGQVAIQLFDVSNPSNISQAAAITPDIPGNGGSYSAAEYDPHAFSYFPDDEGAAFPGTLSVPLHSYDGGSGQGFAGFLVVRVDPAGTTPLAEIGRISHDVFVPPGSNSCGGGNVQTFAPCRDAYYAADPRRSVFMEDLNGNISLFTISALGIIASDATTPSTELGRKSLPFEPQPCCVIFLEGDVATASPGSGS